MPKRTGSPVVGRGDALGEDPLNVPSKVAQAAAGHDEQPPGLVAAAPRAAAPDPDTPAPPSP
ncbi:hypothetical protein [Streptomyces achromogenes]|uniref:hypothetical protein n=1 Tax=Streptomyces achromogenes TaxID=67255 RepID=UPI00368DACF4